MIHAIVFTNRERGNQLYERTANFPADAAEEILKQCNNLTAPSSVQETAPVLCYRPLGKRYLLSVILRLLGSDYEKRAHTACVSFLMEAWDADRFFHTPLPTASAVVIDAAKQLLGIRNTPLPQNICDSILQLPTANLSPQYSDTPLAVLLTGAAYSFSDKLTHQVYIQTDASPLDELHNLIRFLPPPLRKYLRFHTGCISARECREIGICYCHNGRLNSILTSGFEGGPHTTKFWHFSESYRQSSNYDNQYRTLIQRLMKISGQIPLYPLLQYAITTWDAYREMSLLVDNAPMLEDVLQCLPEEAVLRIIRCGIAKDWELEQLCQASRRRSPIYRAAHAALKAARTPSEPLLTRVIRKLKQMAPGLLTLLCLVTSVLTFSYVSNGIGGEWVPEALCIAGIFGAGFFLHAALFSTDRSDPTT